MYPLHLNIKGIPTVIVGNHNEAYAPWERAGLKEATLFHIDAHSDMNGITSFTRNGESPEEYASRLSINGFITPAVHYGIFADVFWYNPFAARALQDMGTTYSTRNTQKLLTAEYNVLGAERVLWACPAQDLVDPFRGKWVFRPQLNRSRALVVDIDEDAFACTQQINNVYWRPGTFGWQHRLKKTLRLLRRIDFRPDLITITPSVGSPTTERFTPQHLIEKIQERLITGLENIY